MLEIGRLVMCSVQCQEEVHPDRKHGDHRSEFVSYQSSKPLDNLLGLPLDPYILKADTLGLPSLLCAMVFNEDINRITFAVLQMLMYIKSSEIKATIASFSYLLHSMPYDL